MIIVKGSCIMTRNADSTSMWIMWNAVGFGRGVGVLSVLTRDIQQRLRFICSAQLSFIDI
jgi:hypothetical protein